MNKEVIIDKINNFLIDEFEVDADDISPMANLKKTLELDSLDLVLNWWGKISLMLLHYKTFMTL